MKKPTLAISDIKTKIYARQNLLDSQKKNLFAREEMVFIAHSLHNAYLYGRSSALLNTRYMSLILQMTFELITELSRYKSIEEGSLRHSLSTLELRDKPNWKDELPNIVKNFQQSPNTGYADFLTRPIEALSNEIHRLDETTLHKIFTHERVQELLPVLTYHLRFAVNEGKYFSGGSKSLLNNLFPRSEPLLEGDLSVTLYSESLYLLITAPYTHFVFGLDAVFDLLSFAEKSYVNTDISVSGKVLTFCLSKERAEIWEENSSYRLYLERPTLKELCSKLLKMKEDAQWGAVFAHHLSEQGEI